MHLAFNPLIQFHKLKFPAGDNNGVMADRMPNSRKSSWSAVAPRDKISYAIGIERRRDNLNIPRNPNNRYNMTPSCAVVARFFTQI